MGTGFSHNVECLFSYAKRRICGFSGLSSLLLGYADESSIKYERGRRGSLHVKVDHCQICGNVLL